MKADRMRNAARHLNEERFSAGIGIKMKGSRVVGFTPCQKSLVYLAALCLPGECRPGALDEPYIGDINTETPGPIVTQRAMRTACECHSSLTEQKLLDYEYSKGA